MGTRADSSPFVRLYNDRIGEPINADEAYGYWLFVFGVVFGVVGMAGFLLGPPSSMLREVGFAVAGVGLVLLIAGPVVRLPLRPTASLLVALGALLCVGAVAWFFAVYPGNWLTAGGESHRVITLYGAGLAVIALGGVVVPLLTAPKEERERQAARVRELETAQGDLRVERENLREERENLREELDQREERVEELESKLAESEAAGEEASTGLVAAREEVAALRESRARFELYRDRADEHRWRLRHENGTILATSSRGYSARRRAKQRLAGVRRHSLGAGVLRIEPEDADPEAMAERDDPIDHESRAEFELYEDSAGEHRWRMVHENGSKIARSSEGYTSRRDAMRALDGARAAIEEGAYLTADPTAFEIFRDRSGEYRWRLIHRNGNILADGGQGYTRRTSARDGIESVRNNVDGDRAEFEVYEDAAGQFRWRLVHENGNLIADGGEGYASRDGAEEAVDRVREYAPGANALDIGRAAFEIFEDSSGEHRWRLRHRNGNVLADGGEGFASRNNAREAVDGVKRNATGAEIRDPDDGE